MSASGYDETDMTPEEFAQAVESGIRADVTNLGGRVAAVDWELSQPVSTGSTASTRSEEVRLAGNQTITRYLELAGT